MRQNDLTTFEDFLMTDQGHFLSTIRNKNKKFLNIYCQGNTHKL